MVDYPAWCRAHIGPAYCDIGRSTMMNTHDYDAKISWGLGHIRTYGAELRTSEIIRESVTLELLVMRQCLDFGTTEQGVRERQVPASEVMQQPLSLSGIPARVPCPTMKLGQARKGQ